MRGRRPGCPPWCRDECWLLVTPRTCGGRRFPTSTSRSTSSESSSLPTPPPSFFRLASTASSHSICSRTATPVVPGWTFGYVVENDTGRAKSRKSADRLEGKPEATTRSLGLEILSRDGGAGSGMVLMEAGVTKGGPRGLRRDPRFRDGPRLRS